MLSHYSLSSIVGQNDARLVYVYVPEVCETTAIAYREKFPGASRFFSYAVAVASQTSSNYKFPSSHTREAQ